MQQDNHVKAETLRVWLEEKQPLFVLDVRPSLERQEWYIPGSVHLDAYEKLHQGNFSVLDEVNIPKDLKVVTVCAAGKTSQIAADALRQKGYEAYSLEGGMKAWSLAWNEAVIQDGELHIIQLRRTGKGCLSYIIGSEGDAIVIDASLGVEVYKEIANRNKWVIKYVMDTHIHADHLSRSASLAGETGAELLMPENDKLKYAYKPFREYDEIGFGTSTLRAIKTPGHTLDSTTYQLNNSYLFTGDTLFIDGVGRPDLKASEEETKRRASLLYDSLKKILSLPGKLIVLPGHISKPVEFDGKALAATLEDIKVKVPSLNLSHDDFVDTLLSKIPPTPPNYLKITELNLSGDIQSVEPTEVEAGANRCAIS